MNNTKIKTLSHEVINFRVPADLKWRFDEAASKDERTVSQQLRILMLQYVALSEGSREISEKELQDTTKNISTGNVTRHVKVNKNFTRRK